MKRATQLKFDLSLTQANLNIEHIVQIKVESNIVSKKKKFQDEAIATFQAFKEYIEKQVEYGTTTYVQCLADVEKEFQAKGIDSALPVIVKMRRPFGSSSAPTSSQVTTPHHNPA